MNDVGFTASPEPYMVQGRGEGFKKNPQPSHGRLGILPADTLHSLILEDLFVKNIQAGFLTLPTLTRLPILSPEFVEGSKDSGFLVKALTPKNMGPGLQRRVRPRLLQVLELRGSLHLDTAKQNCFHLTES